MQTARADLSLCWVHMLLGGNAVLWLMFSLPVQKYRKSYCTTPGVGVGGSIGFNKNVKVLHQSF